MPGLVFGVAKLLKVTAVALGLAGIADLTAVMNELVGKRDPVVLGNDLHEFLLDLLGGFGFGQAEAAGDAVDMGINDDAFGLVETDAEDDVGGLAGGAGDGDELGEGLGDLAVEFFGNFAGGSLDGFGLVTEEAGGADEVFELGQGGLGHGLRGREAAEELRRDHVDANVSALRGEDGGDEEFPGRGVREGALDFGVGFVEGLEDSGDAFGGQVATSGLLRSLCGFLGDAFLWWVALGHDLEFNFYEWSLFNPKSQKRDLGHPVRGI